MKSETTPLGALYVSDEHLILIARRIHYPEHWDTAAYPDLGYALCEMADKDKCSECEYKREMTQTCLEAIHGSGI